MPFLAESLSESLPPLQGISPCSKHSPSIQVGRLHAARCRFVWVLSVTSLPLHPALVWAHPHKFGRFDLVWLGDSIEHNPTRQNNSFAWLVRLIRVYFLLFPVSLCALTVVTELRQVRHCAICRLLCPLLCECGPLLIQCGPLLGQCGIQSGFR